VHSREVDPVTANTPDEDVETLVEDAFTGYVVAALETGDPAFDPEPVATQPRPRGAETRTAPSLLEEFMPTGLGRTVVFNEVDLFGLNCAPPVAVLVAPP